jgi:hypothetical protein
VQATEEAKRVVHHRVEPCPVPEPDDDLALFARLSSAAQSQVHDEAAARWTGSPFEWIRAEPSRRKGSIGELLFREWAEAVGFTVTSPTNTGHDTRLNDLPVEVKLSLLWATGAFVFQQLRDQDYAVICLLGLEPHAVSLWSVPKEIAWEHATPQHGGASGQDTRWLRFPASTPPTWLSPYGRGLSVAKRALEQALR